MYSGKLNVATLCVTMLNSFFLKGINVLNKGLLIMINNLIGHSVSELVQCCNMSEGTGYMGVPAP